jgi:hypothetical protein
LQQTAAADGCSREVRYRRRAGGRREGVIRPIQL